MRKIRREIGHFGVRLLVKNPELAKHSHNEKLKFPRFITAGMFECRRDAHDYVLRNHPTYTSKDFRIMGVKMNVTSKDFVVPVETHIITPATEPKKESK